MREEVRTAPVPTLSLFFHERISFIWCQKLLQGITVTLSQSKLKCTHTLFFSFKMNVHFCQLLAVFRFTPHLIEMDAQYFFLGVRWCTPYYPKFFFSPKLLGEGVGEAS